MNANRPGQTPDRIDINNPDSVEHWTRRLDCSREQLQEAINAAGDRPADVELWLKGVHASTNAERVHEAGRE